MKSNKGTLITNDTIKNYQAFVLFVVVVFMYLKREK